MFKFIKLKIVFKKNTLLTKKKNKLTKTTWQVNKKRLLFLAVSFLKNKLNLQEKAYFLTLKYLLAFL
jgi:hypothetical protein